MTYQSKTISLSDEIITWLNELKAKYGSYNKGLTVLKASVPFGSTLPKTKEKSQPENREGIK